MCARAHTRGLIARNWLTCLLGLDSQSQVQGRAQEGGMGWNSEQGGFGASDSRKV